MFPAPPKITFESKEGGYKQYQMRFIACKMLQKIRTIEHSYLLTGDLLQPIS